MVNRAISILGAVEDAAECVRQSGESEGRVRVGAIPTIAPYLLPPVLRDFQKKHRQANICIEEDLTARLVKACVNGEFDVIILALPVDDTPLQTETLFNEELHLAIPAKHPLAQKKRVTIQDVSREPFILLSETHCLGENIVTWPGTNSAIAAH